MSPSLHVHTFVCVCVGSWLHMCVCVNVYLYLCAHMCNMCIYSEYNSAL